VTKSLLQRSAPLLAVRSRLHASCQASARKGYGRIDAPSDRVARVRVKRATSPLSKGSNVHVSCSAT
jgi:hypothetical protein